MAQPHLSLLPLAFLAACVSLPATAPVRPAAADPAGLAFARASCAACHSVERFGASRNSSAPPFPVIVNQEGLTKETLSFWLKGAHNYPNEMDFTLRDQEVDALVTYMLSLRDPHFKRPRD